MTFYHPKRAYKLDHTGGIGLAKYQIDTEKILQRQETYNNERLYISQRIDQLKESEEQKIKGAKQLIQ
jgi:hypothetical protein